MLTGDFNEPSTWTGRPGRRRTDGPLGTEPDRHPLRFPIRWTGSRLLADLGLRDAYRTAFPTKSGIRATLGHRPTRRTRRVAGPTGIKCSIGST